MNCYYLLKNLAFSTRRMAGNRKEIKQLLEDLMALKIGKKTDFACLEDVNLTEHEKSNLTFDEVFALNLINSALNGNMKATTEIMDRRYGKAQQNIVAEVKTTSYHNYLVEMYEEDRKEQDSQSLSQGAISVSFVEEGSVEDDLLSDLGLLP